MRDNFLNVKTFLGSPHSSIFISRTCGQDRIVRLSSLVHLWIKKSFFQIGIRTGLPGAAADQAYSHLVLIGLRSMARRYLSVGYPAMSTLKTWLPFGSESSSIRGW